MSTIGAPTSNNPYSYVQTLRQQGQSQSSAAQGDSQSQQFAVTGPQGVSAAAPVSAATPAAASSGATASGSGGSFPRFDPQTLRTLLALQATNG